MYVCMYISLILKENQWFSVFTYLIVYSFAFSNPIVKLWMSSHPVPIPCHAILLCTTYTQSIRKINWTVKWKSVNGFSIHCTIFLLCFSFVFSEENFFIFFVLLFIIQFFVTVLAEKLIDHLSDCAHSMAVVWGFRTTACKVPLFISLRGKQFGNSADAGNFRPRKIISTFYKEKRMKYPCELFSLIPL